MPNLYTIYVTGTLDFEQDLIFSNTITFESLVRLATDFSLNKSIQLSTNKELDQDTPHIGGDMVLARKEIRYGIITSDLLEIIKKMANTREFNELCTDELALQHIKKFCKAYNIDFRFNVEHKQYAKTTAYFNKVNNAVLLQDKEGNNTTIEFKIRSERKDVNTSPLRELFKQALGGVENPKISEFTVTETKIYSINDFRNAHSKKDIDTGNIKNLPGHSATKTRNVRFNNTQIHIDYINQYNTIKQRETRETTMFNKTLEEQGLIPTLQDMNNNILPSRKKKKTNDQTLSLWGESEDKQTTREYSKTKLLPPQKTPI